MNFLSSVDIFSSIDLYELSQVCDALKLERFGPNELIIKQYEEGNKFYIVESGEAYAFLINNGEEEEKIVREYKRGGFFGELALIRDEPRAANVKTKVFPSILILD